MKAEKVGFLVISVEYDESASGKAEINGVYKERYGKCARRTGDKGGTSWLADDDVDVLSSVESDE